MNKQEELKSSETTQLLNVVGEIIEKKSADVEKEVKEIKGMVDSLGVQAIKDEVVNMSAKINALNEKSYSNTKGMTIKEIIKQQIISKKDKWNSFKNGEIKSFSFDLETKAAAAMLVSTNTGSSSYLPYVEVTPSYNELVRNRPFIENFANTSSTSNSRIVWVNQVDPEGDAAFISEGELKPLIDFNFETEISSAKKVADKIKISTEMLEDIDFCAAAIEQELKYKIDISVDNGLLSGDGLGDNLKGITEYASAFVLTTIDYILPKNSDAIIAASFQIKSLNFEPNYAFINTIDLANIMGEKTEDGMPIMRSLNELGVTVVSTNQIPQGYLLVGDMSKFIVRNYKPFSFTYGHTGDDFEKNYVTVIGERRLHNYVSDNHTGAFVYDSFDNIKTAILAL